MMDESIVKFNELSIIDGIDEILAHIIEIEQMIDNKNSVKNRLLIVQKKLKNTRTKCNKRDINICKNNTQTSNKHTLPNDASTTADAIIANNKTHSRDCNSLQLKLDQLNKEIKSTNRFSLSMLVEVKKIEQQATVQHQQIEVKKMF